MKAARIVFSAGAALGVAGLVAAAMSGGERPRPHAPPGPPTPRPRRPMARPTPPRDATDAPDELFVERDCSDWNVGPTWDAEVLMPALAAWRDAGWNDPDDWHHHTVVREVLAPYVACIDEFPWMDRYLPGQLPPPDAWVQQWRAVEARYPQVGRLIETVLSAYNGVLSGLLQA